MGDIHVLGDSFASVSLGASRLTRSPPRHTPAAAHARTHARTHACTRARAHDSTTAAARQHDSKTARTHLTHAWTTARTYARQHMRTHDSTPPALCFALNRRRRLRSVHARCVWRRGRVRGRGRGRVPGRGQLCGVRRCRSVARTFYDSWLQGPSDLSILFRTLRFLICCGVAVGR